MSDKATLSEIREAYARPQGLFGHYGMGSRATEFDEMIAEVERAAAEKAWREGELAGTRNQRDFSLYQDMKITDTEYRRREAGRANPYRREETE